MFSNTLLMKNYKPMSQAFKSMIEVFKKIPIGTLEWELMIKFLIKCAAIMTYIPKVNLIYFNMFWPLIELIIKL